MIVNTHARIFPSLIFVPVAIFIIVNTVHLCKQISNVYKMALIYHIIHGNRHRRRPRIFKRRLNPLEENTEEEIRRRYRLSRALIEILYDKIGFDLEPQTNRNRSIPAINKICCAFRYYASGSFQAVLGENQ